MRITAATVNGFRNLQDQTFSFSPRVNLVLGRNGEGKTNLLEALNYFALGRSHRGSRAEEMVAFDGESLHVSLEVEEESGQLLACEFGLDKQGGRRLRLDGEPVTRRADLVGRLSTVFFNPDSVELVRGGPLSRRHFVDQGWSEIEAVYLRNLTAFQRALKQKTGLLRDLKKGFLDRTTAREELTAWNREIAVYAAEVCLGRRKYTELLTPFADLVHRALTDTDQSLEFVYRPSLESLKKTDKKGHLADDIFTEFDYIIESEIKRGRPLIGPQLDDCQVLLDGLDLRTFGSQGETRTAAISLILARSDVLFERRQIRPVLFFDDIFSELDRERTRRLQDLATRLHQVFIATARRDDVEGWHPEGLKVWRVSAGKFTDSAD